MSLSTNKCHISSFEKTLRNITWYQDRQLSEITLGGLIVLVVIRAIQYNISRTRVSGNQSILYVCLMLHFFLINQDKFLHTNLLATLANMSNYFKQLSPYVCQKLTTLFKKLSKKFNRTLSQVNQTHDGSGADIADNRSEADTDITSANSPDLVNDLSIYEEV